MKHHDMTARLSHALSVFVFCAGVLLHTGCGMKDDREAKSRNAVVETTLAESQGALSLTGFEKTDGFKQVVGGTEMYILEWKAQLLVTKDTRTPRPFDKGTLLERTGNATLRATEKGWRVENMHVATSQVVCDLQMPTGPAITSGEFKGRWKIKATEDGQAPTDVLTITASNRGAVQINLINSDFAGEFREVTFNRGMLCGTYVVTVDNEHKSRFQIKSLSPDMFEYRDELRATRFARVPSPFVGNWISYNTSSKMVLDASGNVSGYEQEAETSPSSEYVIALDKGAYVVKWSYLSEPDRQITWIGNEVNGKLVAEGDAKDFYKFEIPTIKVLADGNLRKDEGTGITILKRKVSADVNSGQPPSAGINSDPPAPPPELDSMTQLLIGSWKDENSICTYYEGGSQVSSGIISRSGNLECRLEGKPLSRTWELTGDKLEWFGGKTRYLYQIVEINASSIILENILPESARGKRWMQSRVSEQITNQAPVHPSFDCKKATIMVEKLICGSNELAGLDGDLSGIYKRFSASGIGGNVYDEQIAWLKTRDICSESNCVKQAYEARIADLQLLASGQRSVR